jgi:hypothetical protein
VSASLDNALTQMTLAQCRFAIPNQHDKAREATKNLGRGNVSSAARLDKRGQAW